MIDLDAYISIERVVELTGRGRRTIYEKVARGELAVKPAEEPGSNGKRGSLVAVGSLSLQAQTAYWQAAMRERLRTELPGVNLAEIPERCREEALRRFRIVEEALAIQSERSQSKQRLEGLATYHSIAVTTLYGWIGAYDREKIAGLIPKWGQTRGTFTALSTELQAYLKDEYLSPQRPSVTTVYRRAVSLCEHLRQPAPSVATINRFIRTLPQAAVALAREGRRSWQKAYEPKCHRDLTASAPNEWWCGDHRELDVFVRLSDQDGAKIARVWVTAWLDLSTRTCVGWNLCIVPNSDSIALALRTGLLTYGVPQNLYIDNGKDYRCHYLNGSTTVSRNVALSEQTRMMCIPGVLAPLGVQITHAKAYQPWSKPIEPWFGHVFPAWERTLPGWCGSDNRERPEKLKTEIKEGRLLTVDELRGRLEARINEVHDFPHPDLKDTTPKECWNGVTIERPDARALDLLLMRHKPVKVYHQGIKLFGSNRTPRYYWHNALWQYVGHTVDVRYDPNEIGRLAVFVNNRFVCEAVNDPALRMGASAEDLKVHHRRKRHAERNATNYLNERRILQSPEQVLAEIAEERRAKQVVNLRPHDPRPTSGADVIPRLTGMEHAVASVKRGTGPSRRAGKGASPPGSTRPAGYPPLPGATTTAPALDPNDPDDPTWRALIDGGPELGWQQREREREEEERHQAMQQFLES